MLFEKNENDINQMILEKEVRVLNETVINKLEKQLKEY